MIRRLPCLLAAALMPASDSRDTYRNTYECPTGHDATMQAFSSSAIWISPRSITDAGIEPPTKGYTITFQRRSHSEKRGPQTEILYRAVVRELPRPDADGNNYAGVGRYSVRSVQQKANCKNDLPDEYEVIEGEGTLRATATVSGTADKAFVVFSLTPVSGPRLQLFTRSFRAMDQKVAEESGMQDEDLPFLASPAIGGVEVAPDSGSDRKEGGIGPTECDGMIITTSSAQVVRIGAPCDKAPELSPELAAERSALVKGMQDAGFGVGPQHINVTMGSIAKFGVRLAEGGCVLPTIESIKSRCSPSGTQKGAKRLLVGAVQHAGNTTRVTARIVEAETAIILEAAKADAKGSGADATAAALADALKQLKLEAGCVE